MMTLSNSDVIFFTSSTTMSFALTSSSAATAVLTSLSALIDLLRVKLARPNIIEYRVGKQITRAACAAQTLADHGGGNVERSDGDHGNAPRGCEMHGERLAQQARGVFSRERLRHAFVPCVNRKARAVRDDDVREIEDVVPAVPRREIEECIGADQQAQRTRVSHLISELGQCVDRIARSATPHLALIDPKQRVVGHGEFHHGEPVFGGDARCRTVRRRAARHEPHLFELQRIAYMLRQPQMPVVYGVERTAEYPDGRCTGHVCASACLTSTAPAAVYRRAQRRDTK